jgi:DNA end-binding protein Ku
MRARKPFFASPTSYSKVQCRVSTKKKFDFSAYHDVYTEKLTKLIEAKVAGEEITAPPAQEEKHIINLMDALRASVANAVQEEPAGAKPQKKIAPSKGKESRARKRKTS